MLGYTREEGCRKHDSAKDKRQKNKKTCMAYFTASSYVGGPTMDPLSAPTVFRRTEKWIGNVLRGEGKLDEAVEYFNSALASEKDIFGGDHEEVGNTMFFLAIIKHFKEVSCC